jgi:hypothetical protein
MVEAPAAIDAMEKAVKSFYRPHAAKEVVQALT